MKRAIGRNAPENELFKEPGGVGAMPFCRARIGHGLQALVFGTEGRGMSFGTRAHLRKAAPKSVIGKSGMARRTGQV